MLVVIRAHLRILLVGGVVRALQRSSLRVNEARHWRHISVSLRGEEHIATRCCIRRLREVRWSSRVDGTCIDDPAAVVKEERLALLSLLGEFGVVDPSLR